MIKGILIPLICLIGIQASGQIKGSQAIDSLFSEWNNTHSPGCALGIIQDGTLIYGRGYGQANLEYTIPNTDSTVFRIGSTSKQFTAACIIRLVEQGKLTLDNSLKDLFPAFPDYAAKITVQHLLNHTSGIRDYLQLAYLKGLGDDDYYRDQDVMDWLVHQSDLNFEPGDEFLYSNSGYWLLGQIVNKVTGKNMAEYADQELFQPLGMTHTHFHNDHTQIVKTRASGYVPDGKDGFRISMTTLDMIGDGGIFTTIKDLKKWDDAYYRSNILSNSFWQMMTKPGMLNNGEQLDYASGLFIQDYKGLKTIRHGGAFVGFRAELLRFPEQHCTIVLLANRGDARASVMANRVADIVLKQQFMEISGRKSAITENIMPATTKEIALQQLTGNYEIQPGLYLQLALRNDTLHVVQSWDQSSFDIQRTMGNNFRIPGNPDIQFTFANLENDLAQQLVVVQNDNRMELTRMPEISMKTINQVEYSGDYYSIELDVTYHLTVENERLWIRINNNDPAECQNAGKDAFTTDLGLVRFQRNQGILSGFELDSGRVKNLKFVKL